MIVLTTLRGASNMWAGLAFLPLKTEWLAINQQPQPASSVGSASTKGSEKDEPGGHLHP